MAKSAEKKQNTRPAGKLSNNISDTENGSSGEAGDGMGSGNVDKIRDILFGPQMQDYEKRFAHIEKYLLKELAVLRDETTKRFNLLENDMKEEVASLNDQLKNEQVEREGSHKALLKQLNDSSEALGNRIDELNVQLNKTSSELLQRIEDQSKSISGDIQKRHEQTSVELDRVTQSLQKDKMDRLALSELFAEMAVRLSSGEVMKPNQHSEK